MQPILKYPGAKWKLAKWIEVKMQAEVAII
jgi:site-specific DNA-adenine methylase